MNGRTTVGFERSGFGDDDERAAAVAVQPDNKVVTAGPTGAFEKDFFVHRLTAAGEPDTSFGAPANNGAAFINFGGSDLAWDLELLPDGKIAVAGDNTSCPNFTSCARDVAVARLTGGGDLDSSFGVGGKRTIVLPNNQVGRTLAVQPDGGFLVAGQTYVGNDANTSNIFVMRIGKFTPRRGGPGGPPPARPGLAKVAISAKSLKASAKGIVGVKLRCSAAAACAGTVDLTTARKVSISAKKRKLKLARRSYSIPAGKTKTIKLKLKGRGFRLLRKRRKLRVRLTITTRRTGAAAAKVGRTVTLKASPKRKRKRQR